MAQFGGGFAPEATGVGVLVLHNLAVHRLLPSPADAVLNLVTAASLTAFARRAGCSHDDLGIRAADAAAGLRLGLIAAAVAAGGVVVGASLPATRPLFHDRRVTAVDRRFTGRRRPGQDDLLILASVLALDLAEDKERRQH